MYKFENSLFLCLKEAQRKSLQKETLYRKFRPLRRAIQGAALKTRELLKKLDQNFHQIDENRCFALKSGGAGLCPANFCYLTFALPFHSKSG